MPNKIALFDQGPPPACPTEFNLGRYTIDAGQDPDKVALILASSAHDFETWSYGALCAAVRGTMTGLLEQGISAGDRILLRLGHTVDFPILFFALTGIGALPVPTAPGLTKPEIDRLAELLQPRLTISGTGQTVPNGPRLPLEETHAWRKLPPAPWANTQADDPAYIIFTSGTGGQPRGVVHAHRAAWARRMMWRDWYGLTAADTLMHGGAFNWTYTLGTGLTDPWAAGATALIYTGPADPGIWADLARAHAVTLFAAAPGVYRQLLSSGRVNADAFTHLRHGLSAGEAMAPRLVNLWKKATGKPLYQALGMSECSTYASQSPTSPDVRPQSGRRIAILKPNTAEITGCGDIGRIGISCRDPGLMLGYLTKDGSQHLPLEGEWFVTGDMGEMTPEHVLHHHGRSDDILNAQGFRVSAREVEGALLDHKGIAEAAALSLPVREDVEVLTAVVIPNTNADVSEASLQAYCRTRLADYKVPRKIILTDTFPRTATGKIIKRKLADTYGWKEDK